MSATRLAELAANLQAVEKRLSVACEAAGRRRDELCLIAVTKTFPDADIAALATLGVTDFGENRDAEAAAKAAAFPDLRWHFVGRLQRNKCRSVATYADVVHSVDRVEVVAALAAGARRAEREIAVLVQVSLDGDPGRGGAQPADVAAVAGACASAAELRLTGVMAIAPLNSPVDEAFRRLAEIVATVRATHPAARAVSAGMSGDLESAIRHGATHLRIGTALLGHRTPPPG
ncbi:MAG: YggS family pyridoxal phosphate-dependent enzyme [Jatrophihabitantaceae bacterium]